MEQGHSGTLLYSKGRQFHFPNGTTVMTRTNKKSTETALGKRRTSAEEEKEPRTKEVEHRRWATFQKGAEQVQRGSHSDRRNRGSSRGQQGKLLPKMPCVRGKAKKEAVFRVLSSTLQTKKTMGGTEMRMRSRDTRLTPSHFWSDNIRLKAKPTWVLRGRCLFELVAVIPACRCRSSVGESPSERKISAQFSSSQRCRSSPSKAAVLGSAPYVSVLHFVTGTVRLPPVCLSSPTIDSALVSQNNSYTQLRQRLLPVLPLRLPVMFSSYVY